MNPLIKLVTDITPFGEKRKLYKFNEEVINKYDGVQIYLDSYIHEGSGIFAVSEDIKIEGRKLWAKTSQGTFSFLLQAGRIEYLNSHQYGVSSLTFFKDNPLNTQAQLTNDDLNRKLLN